MGNLGPYRTVFPKSCVPATLPDRSQFNRLMRFYADDIEQMAVKLGQMMEDGSHPYQALDASAIPVRDVKRRGHGCSPEPPTSAGRIA